MKFSDIELVGIPFRVTVSARGLAAGTVEVTDPGHPHHRARPGRRRRRTPRLARERVADRMDDKRMIIIAVLVSVVALAVALVALVRQIHHSRAQAIKATARMEGGLRLTIEVINTGASSITLQAIGLWVSVDKQHGVLAEPGELHDWEDLWELTGSVLTLASPTLPTDLDGGIWKAWTIDLEPGHPIELPGARAYVTVYLKGGTTTALVQV